ncbi:NAD(P)/FAD-dependent oxidoreductase [Limoniibacter endophyticus]|uniref:Dehydrogenase n=1 Tax=Limoniibacter endophyticus TaxID=1565040 RepID=A0A8J3DSK1_9HYPH|nr:FAD-binding oxidoreductase [Limoniibacter endophyticus]GHC72573.1 dehydrogenase [Limoniibacter endophyticus]
MSATHPTPRISVAVLGGGIIGLYSALELLDRGYQVSLIEPAAPGGRQAASYGNGTWINEGAIIPISLPGLWKSIPGFLRDPTGPFVIQASHIPRILPWLIRFVAAGRSWQRVERDIPARLALLKGAVSHYQARAANAGMAELIGTQGVMYVYRNRAEYELDLKAWDLRKKYGIACSMHEGTELRRYAPDLSPDYKIGMRILPAISLRDPGAFCAGLARLFQRHGGRLVAATAKGFDLKDNRLRGVHTDQGTVTCDRAVIAAGIGSAGLARAAGDRVPLIAERGYHIEILDCPIRLVTSLMPADGKMAVASTRAGLRLAGQVELASCSSAPDWRRARIQLTHACRMFPQIKEKIENGPHDMWMGNRPSTPDCLPVIGTSSGSPDIFHAFGHGHTGMVMAPNTARLVAGLLSNAALAIDPQPYSPRRFRFVA